MGDEIKNFYQQWFGAMESEEIDRFLSLLDQDFYLKNPAQPPITDRENLRQGLQQYHSLYRSKVKWRIENIQLFDRHAVVRVAEKVILTNRETEGIKEINGIHLSLLVKNDDGQWRLKTDVSSLNHPITE